MHHGNDSNPEINALFAKQLEEANPEINALFAKQLEEAVKASAEAGKLGPTGQHPNGKLVEGDEGEIRLAVAVDRERGVVILNFGTPVAWAGMTAQQAREVGVLLCRKASEIDGTVTRISVEPPRRPPRMKRGTR